MTADPHAEARQIAEEAREALTPNRYGKVQGDYLPSPREHLWLAEELEKALAREERLREALGEARQQIANAFAEVATARKDRRALQRQIERGKP